MNTWRKGSPMTSIRKRAANKRNSFKSSGPRSAAGKKIASRNALKHGLAAVVNRQPAPSAEIEQLAQRICGSDANPALLEQARCIAINQMALRIINGHKIALADRLREQTAIALAKGDNSRTLAIARFLQAWLAHRQIEALVPKVQAKYREQISPPHLDCSGRALGDGFGMIPLNVKALLEEDTESPEAQRNAMMTAARVIESAERDEHEVIEEGALDLLRLDRYERRNWSRYKRAIRSYINLKIMDLYRASIST
jgi:hypothetical protein